MSQTVKTICPTFWDGKINERTNPEIKSHKDDVT